MRKLAFALALSVFPVAALGADADLNWLYSVADAIQPPGVAAGGGGAGAAVPPQDMPTIVAVGKGQDVRPCSSCHGPSGSGQPESANLRGLPAAYFQKAVMDFQNGAHKGIRAVAMIQIAKGLTDAELKDIAPYYSAMKPFPWSKVVEAGTIPKSYISPTGARRAWPDGGMEPIGNRIVEFAEDQGKIRQPGTELAFSAFVPPGSIAKGEPLVTNGGAGKTTACALCHGDNLKGLGDIPSLAGRSPLYIARQMVEFQNGDRTGPNATLMKAVVAKLQMDDIIAIAAFVGSRNPS